MRTQPTSACCNLLRASQVNGSRWAKSERCRRKRRFLTQENEKRMFLYRFHKWKQQTSSFIPFFFFADPPPFPFMFLRSGQVGFQVSSKTIIVIYVWELRVEAWQKFHLRAVRQSGLDLFYHASLWYCPAVFRNTVWSKVKAHFFSAYQSNQCEFQHRLKEVSLGCLLSSVTEKQCQILILKLQPNNG